ncbi:MAG TPA: Plug domain-containing protein [Gemmatimonadaceae bacterium]|nr:Plug domain-containing protein [Gemmatimonadaceae bacterium]
MRPPVIVAPNPLPPDSQAVLDTATVRQRRDSLRADSLKADTLRAPTARAEAPMLPETGTGWRWNRDEMFASGALNLAELLERVPGAIQFRAGWIHTPQAISFLGDPGAVRVFLDGVEMDALDPRTGNVLDLAEVPIWTLEEVRIERGARELRVHLRSWRYDRTIANTRFDAGTGDLGTNLYRGYFAKRYAHGEVLQAGLQRYSTSDPRTGLAGGNAGGSSLALMLRAGWARGPWSADAFIVRDGRARNTEISYNVRSPNFVQKLGPQIADSIPALRATRTDAYVRGAYGDPESGPWLQAIAATSGFRESTGQSGSRLPRPVTHADSVRGFGTLADTQPSRAQYVFAGGLTRWGARISATSRTRVYGGLSITSPSARASWDTRFGAVSARAERDGFNHSNALEAGITALPLPFISLSAVAERRQGANDASPAGSAVRAEAGLHVVRAWIAGGVLLRDSAFVDVPSVFYSDFAVDSVRHPPSRVAVGQARGTFVSVRGKLYRDVGLDAVATRWTSPDLFRPQLEARTELFFRTQWLRRFPEGHFGFNATAIHEYRSAVRFPSPSAAITAKMPGSQVLSTLIEIHIRTAYISWQLRNIIGNQYGFVPGYLMPQRSVNFYGVRWEFYN